MVVSIRLMAILLPLAVILAGCAADGQPQSAGTTAVAAPQPALSRQAAESRFAEGVAYARQGDTDRAIVVFEELIRQYPDIPGPYNNLAVLYASRGQYDQARQVLLKAIEIQPDLDTAHENLGDVYSKLAAQTYERAYEINAANLRAQSKSELVNRMLHARKRRSEAISAGAPAGLAVPALRIGPQPATAVACYQVGPIVYRVDAEAIAAWARLQGLEASAHGESREDDVSYYHVYLPPFATRQEAEQALGTLRTAGVHDVDIMPQGILKNGISLGVYRNKSSAEDRLTLLREIGVQPVLETRRRERERYLVDIMGRGDNAWRARFAAAFPAQTLQWAECSETTLAETAAEANRSRRSPRR